MISEPSRRVLVRFDDRLAGFLPGNAAMVDLPWCLDSQDFDGNELSQVVIRLQAC